MEKVEEESKNKNYEVTCLLREEDFSSVRELLGAHEASVISEGPIQKVKLEYPVGGQEQAFLGSAVFGVDVESLSSLVAELNMEKNVLRHLIAEPARKSEVVDGAVAPEGGGTAGDRRLGNSSRGAAEAGEGARELTNEALEKKIEEILK